MTTVPTSPASDDTSPARGTALITMGVIARTRHAARIAYAAIRTGRHETAEAYMTGVADGMDVGLSIAKDKYQSVLGGIPAQRTGGAR